VLLCLNLYKLAFLIDKRTNVGVDVLWVINRCDLQAVKHCSGTFRSVC
jgi:hypothetical protein